MNEVYSIKQVMIPVYAHTLVFVLAVTGLVGCVGRFDYNLVLALGWLYLGDLNRQITNSVGFYVLLFGSVVIDGITIILSSGKGEKFTFLFVPILQILIKFGVAAVSAQHYYSKKQKENNDNDFIEQQQNIQNQ